MEAIEIVVIVFAVLLVAFTAGLAIYRKKKGKSSCGCDCSAKKDSKGSCEGCPYRGACKSTPTDSEKVEDTDLKTEK